MKIIGTEARISLADFSGEFINLEPWQRELVETIAAIPPDQRDKVAVVVGADGTASVASALAGTRGDRIIIDDPWADSGALIDMDAARRLFLDGLPQLADGTDPVIVMFRLCDEPLLKLAEAERLERRPRYAREYLAPAMEPAPCNRAQRRADEARRRKGRR